MIQALHVFFVMVLQSKFEKIFEIDSYGFEFGRSLIDTIKQIQNCCIYSTGLY